MINLFKKRNTTSEVNKKKSTQEIIKELEKLKKLDGKLLTLESRVLEANNAELSYWFYMNVKSANQKAHRKVIIDSKNPKLNYNIAKEITSSLTIQKALQYSAYVENLKNIKAHGKAVIDSGDPKYNYYFAYCVVGADIKAHEQVVLASRNTLFNYLFAREIDGADIKSHGRVVIDSGDPEYNYLFARDIEGADVRAHGQVVIDSGNPEYNYLFARDIKDSDVEAHWKVVQASNKRKLKKEFVVNVPGMVAQNIASSLDNMIKTKKK